MAGSKKWFVYSTDKGEDFAIELDESNTEAVNGTTGDFTASTSITYAIPKNLRPRRAFYASANGDRVIGCVVLTQSAYNSISDDTPTITDPITGVGNLTLVRIRAEQIRLPYAVDTGLDDGDST